MTYLQMFKTLGAMILAGVLIMALFGCEENPQPKEIAVKRAEAEDAPVRFEIKSAGKFHAGYNGNVREILIIKDKETGKEYLGITGVGITEFHTERHGKTTVTREE